MNLKIGITTGIVLLILFGFLIFNYNNSVSAINNVEVIVRDVTIIEAKLTQCQLKLIVNISNPTDVQLSDITSNFDIYLSGDYIGEGKFSKITIPPHSYRWKDIMITIYYEGLADAVIDIIGDLISGKKVTLTIEGTINATTFFGIIPISKDFKSDYI